MKTVQSIKNLVLALTFAPVLAYYSQQPVKAQPSKQLTEKVEENLGFITQPYKKQERAIKYPHLEPNFDVEWYEKERLRLRNSYKSPYLGSELPF